ncbi:MAG: hypothetical protein GXP15_01930 [Gammaproteobacteria bacterium]|nr:hypothetical protein [Gammaproteobacteria bacterium]
MVYVLFAAISFGFGILLHSMARHRNGNPRLWFALGAGFWFLPIPFLLMFKRHGAPDDAGSSNVEKQETGL